MRDLVQPFRLPGFRRLLSSYTLNEVGDWLATIALAIVVWDATHDPFATTALFVATKFLPALFVAPLAARLDGLPARGMFAALYAVEASALVGLAFVASSFWLPAVLVLAAVVGIAGTTARAAIRAANVAILEPAGLLREGNAALNLGFSAMNAGAPALAGVSVALVGAGPVLVVAAIVSALQGVLLATAPGLRRGAVDESPWRSRLRAGLSYVRHTRPVATLLFGQGLVLVLLTMVTPIEVIYAKETLDAGDAGLGVLLTAWGAGMVLGSWVFATQRGRAMTTMIVVSTVAIAAGYLGMAVAPSLAIACAASALGGLGNGVQWVAVVTALQEATADRFQARVAGVLEAVMTAAPGIGFLIGGSITALLSPRVAFAAAGAGVLVILVLGAATLRRLPRVVPGAEPEPQPAAA